MPYITLDTDKLDNIIINALSKVYPTHSGFACKTIRDALIENSFSVNPFDGEKINSLKYDEMMQWENGDIPKEEIDRLILEYKKSPVQLFKSSDIKNKSIEFANFRETYQRHESQYWHIQNQKHGMHTWVGASDEKIYEAYLKGEQRENPLHEKFKNENTK